LIPGGASAGTAEGTTASKPVSVISSIIFRDENHQEILLGVRQNSPLSPRHPGVLSTPTMRMPKQLYSAVTGGRAPDQVGVTCLSGHDVFPIGAPRSLAEPSSFALEALLTRKLGLADALMAGRFQGEAVLSAVSLDAVEDPQGDTGPEWTLMVSYSLTIKSGADEIPPETRAYSPLIWGAADRLAVSYFSHDALLMDESLNPFEVCISGLCIRSAVEVITQNH
jgi:hypothetical protein